jgi:hypothetical protein
MSITKTRIKEIAELQEIKDAKGKGPLAVYVACLDYLKANDAGYIYLRDEDSKVIALKMLTAWNERPKSVNHDGIGQNVLAFVYNKAEKFPLSRKDFESIKWVLT